MNDANTTTAVSSAAPAREAETLREISPQQWKSGAAAWLGWLFDGLDMHIYTLVATAFVAILLNHGSFRSEFSKLDADGNGQITTMEWAGAEQFTQADRDRNG